jgi:hypothetical protein
MVSYKPSPEWDVTATTAIHIKRTRNKKEKEKLNAY